MEEKTEDIIFQDFLFSFGASAVCDVPRCDFLFTNPVNKSVHTCFSTNLGNSIKNVIFNVFRRDLLCCNIQN